MEDPVCQHETERMREDFGDDAKAVLEVLVQREPKTSRGEEATRGGGGVGGWLHYRQN